MTRGDLPQVIDLWQALMANGHAADARMALMPQADAWMVRWSRDVWLAQKPFPQGFVADEGQIVGFVTGYPEPSSPVVTQPPSLRIGDLYVAEGARRKGLGKALVDTIVEAASAVGYTGVVVETLVRDARAVGFWEAQGFLGERVQLRK